MAPDRRLFVISLSLLLSTLDWSEAQPCNNMCSGHGNCVHRLCECWQGWQGADCSERTCPSDSAWFDRAIAHDTAHQSAECANMGLCDRQTGQCECRDGFDGLACNRITCPNDCSGHGLCHDMSHHASLKDAGEGTVFAYDEIWDSDMLYGCQCDEGFFGPDCSQRHCPRGDDPLTGSTIDPAGVQRNEVQTVTCRATSGSFTLSFRGFTTESISHDASVSAVKEKLLALPSISDAVVEAASGSACGFDTSKLQITFNQEFGDVPLLVGDSSKLAHSTSTVRFAVKEEFKGDKEDAYCAERGLCNTQSGVCDCFDHFLTSDGYGKRGQRGDCGYPTIDVTACPGEISCSGHGVCKGYPTYTCTCAQGWQGADCSQRICPFGKAWFEFPTDENTAHSSLTPVECSNQGVCDRESGQCRCHDLFEGASCERLSCPVGAVGITPDMSSAESSIVCSGHGQCLSMRSLAEATLTNCDDGYCHHGNPTSIEYGKVPNDPSTWDYDMIQGCLCDDGWQGYDCSERTCPHGDDPHTAYSWLRYNTALQKNIYQEQVNEIQTFTCAGSKGGFYLSFRGAQTPRLSYGITATQLEVALETLSTVYDVQVSFDEDDDSLDVDTSAVCTSAGRSLTIEFLVPTSDLPAIQYSLDGVSSITISESQTGTKEYKECSGRGLCDRGSGECQCFDGFSSSDGQGNAGARGDCGHAKVFSGALVDGVSCKEIGAC